MFYPWTQGFSTSFSMDTEHTPTAPQPERSSIEPGDRTTRSLRQRLDLKGEFVLALLPTLTVLAVLGFVETVSHQRLLFTSLASSAFLIYLDPEHGVQHRAHTGARAYDGSSFGADRP